MEIQKFSHACFVAKLGGQSLIVDPGELSPDFTVPENPQAVIITHIHADHFDKSKLDMITRAYPTVPIFGPDEVVSEVESMYTHAVHAGDEMGAGKFTLTFTGGEHASIHPMRNMCANVGVLINNELYYPGDSFALPPGGTRVKTLAIPAAAPWIKVAEAMDFIMQLKPQSVFPTHDGVLSDAGKKIQDNWLQMAANEVGAQYFRL